MAASEQDFVILPGGVHLWGPFPAQLGDIPDEVIERESKGQTLHLLDTPGWSILESQNVVITGDLPPEALRAVAVTGEELNKMLIRDLGGASKGGRYRIRIFDKREDFCRYAGACGASNALSLYDPRTREIALHFSHATDRENFESTYAHEFTHAYMDAAYGVREPLWFAEGMAEYFSRLKWINGGYRPTGKNWKAMLYFDGPSLLSLPEILEAKREAIYGVMFPLYYAQSWALVHFLLKKHPEIVNSLLKREKFDLSLLAKDYRAYLKRLSGV